MELIKIGVQIGIVWFVASFVKASLAGVLQGILSFTGLKKWALERDK